MCFTDGLDVLSAIGNCEHVLINCSSFCNRELRMCAVTLVGMVGTYLNVLVSFFCVLRKIPTLVCIVRHARIIEFTSE